MTPALDIEAACAGCFLNEQTHGVCPMAIDVYRLEVLRAAILAEAPTATLAELLLREANVIAGLRRPAALPPGTQEQIVKNSERKEAEYVPAAGSIR